MLNSRTKNSLLMFLIIFILTQFLRYFNNTQTSPDDSLIRTVVIVDHHSRNCFYVAEVKPVKSGLLVWKKEKVGFKLPNCTQYRLGSLVEVVSNQTSVIANKKSSLKILKHPSIRLKGQSRLSLFIKWRQFSLKYFRQILGSPEGEVLFSLMFGGKDSLPDFIKTQLNILGLNHLLAVSGLHLTIFVGLSWFFLRRLPKIIGLLSLSFLVVFYLAMSLFRPSVTRAGLMILSLFWSREYFRRQYRAWWGLMTVFVSLLIFNLSLISSISFQFSFLATLAILLVTWASKDESSLISLELVNQKLFRQPKKSNDFGLLTLAEYFRVSLKLSLAVNLVLFPLVAGYFQSFSFWSLISTGLFLWLLPLIFITGIVLLLLYPLVYLGSFGWLLLQTLALWLVLPTKFLLWGMSFLAQVRWPYLTKLSWSRWQTLGWYLGLGLLLTWYKSLKTMKRSKND